MNWTEADVPESRILRQAMPFPATSWSLIAECSEGSPADERRLRLERLLRKYWRPVFSFVYRNHARDLDRAKDLTQEFFVYLLEKDLVGRADPARGRFRNYVCLALKRFAGKAARAGVRRKRRPDGGVLSLEAIGEDGAAFDVPDPRPGGAADRFDEDWRAAVVEAALRELRRRAAAEGREVFVELLLACDLEPPAAGRPTYRELAERHGIPVTQVTNGLHWARQRFKSLVLSEIADQVGSAGDFAAEAKDLFGLE